MSLKVTRKIIDSIHSGELEKAETVKLPVFNLEVPKACKDVDSNILLPKNTWHDKAAYDRELQKLG